MPELINPIHPLSCVYPLSSDDTENYKAWEAPASLIEFKPECIDWFFFTVKQPKRRIKIAALMLSLAAKAAMEGTYHLRELPQISCLSRQNFFSYSHVFVATKDVFCRDKSMLVSTILLSCFSKYNFVATSLLLCRQNTCLVATNTSLSRQKWQIQNIFCRDKRFVTASILLWRPKPCFVATDTTLSRQKLCRNKIFTCGTSRQW